MHVCNCYLRFESTYGICCSESGLFYARVQLLSEIRIHFWVLLQWLFSHMWRLCTCATAMHVCKYYLRFESTSGLCFLLCRDYARVQLLSEIRIHLWALLQRLFSEM
ncbi:hypothetical protein CDAR_523141 [Caerostris darwini]|uniref:Uncharacterized protein n=1 Tax=Caerostris darwini TaxID=1538125 RepID=A0AAV4U936_9ARAC|nr:hypothetical protein CDAR_523141 [Caerostris darwini]